MMRQVVGIVAVLLSGLMPVMPGRGIPLAVAASPVAIPHPSRRLQEVPTGLRAAFERTIGREQRAAGRIRHDAGTSSPWSPQQELSVGNGAQGDQFGLSVSISRDGNYALIGALGEGPNGDQGLGVAAGAAYVFVRSGTQWTKQQRVETGLVDSYFGRSVSISGDGRRALVGAFHENSSVGAAYVFVSTAGVWSQEQALSTGVTNGQLGWSVALNGDGSTALIGARGETALAGRQDGAAYVFIRSASTWSQQQRLATGVANGGFGCSVALSIST